MNPTKVRRNLPLLLPVSGLIRCLCMISDALARLGIYQLPSSLPPYPALLPLALSKSTLLDSLVMIVLDWERPWLFLKELKNWIEVLEGVVQRAGEGWEGAEGRERRESSPYFTLDSQYADDIPHS